MNDYYEFLKELNLIDKRLERLDLSFNKAYLLLPIQTRIILCD